MLKGKVIFFPKRKSIVITVSILFLILCISVIANTKKYEPVMTYTVVNKIIVIDAGHGGTDTGAVRGDIIEKEITLGISQKLAKKLGEAGAGVVMIRDTDIDMVSNGEKYNKRKDLTNRVRKANDSKADLYISIHTNAVPSSRWYGAQTFYNATSEPSKSLAVSIQEEFTKSLDTTRKALVGDYFVLKHTEMPAVIVEVGFISNQKEGNLLKDEKYQAKVAEAIYNGILKHMGDKGTGTLSQTQLSYVLNYCKIEKKR